MTNHSAASPLKPMDMVKCDECGVRHPWRSMIHYMTDCAYGLCRECEAKLIKGQHITHGTFGGKIWDRRWTLVVREMEAKNGAKNEAEAGQSRAV